MIALAITPARFLFRRSRLIGLRRMIGVAALGYALVHLTLYAFDQSLDLAVIAREIAGRFYLTIGFVALLAMALLGATSFDATIRNLGAARWRRIHNLIYPLTALALLHFALQSKLAVGEPIILAGCFIWLMGWRLLHRARRDRPAALILLSLAAAISAAAFEAGWYAAATGIDAMVVLRANLDAALAPRPALIVLAAGFLVVALSRIAAGFDPVSPSPFGRAHRLP